MRALRLFFKFITSHSYLVLAFMAFLLAVASFGATKLGIDASSQTLLKKNDPDFLAWQDMSKRYGLSESLVVAFRPDKELLSKDSLNVIQKLSARLDRLENISSTTSILSVPLLKSVKGGLSGILEHTPTLQDPDIDLALAASELASSPIYTNNIVSKDLKSTAILINLKPNLSKDQSSKLISDIRGVLAEFDGAGKLYLGGAGMIASDMIDFIRQDLLVYALLLSILLAICLWLFFRQIYWVLLSIFICASSVVFSAGFFGFMGWQITAVSSNFIAIELIITISIVIHLIATYKEISAKKQSLSPRALAYLTLKAKASPSFWAIFTTVVGFASLCVSDIAPVAMLGLMMSLSVAVSLVVAFVFFGAFTCALAPARTKEQKPGLSLKLTSLAAKLSLNKSKYIFVLWGLGLLFGVWGILQLRAENSFIAYFSKDTEIAKGMLLIDNDLGGTIPLDVIVSLNTAKSLKTQPLNDFEAEFEAEFAKNQDEAKYFFDARRLRIAKSVHEYLASFPFVGSVLSLDTMVSAITQVNGSADSFLISAMYENLPPRYRSVLLSPYVDIKNDELRFAIRIKDSDPELRRGEFVSGLRAGLERLLAPEGASVSLRGAMVLYNNVLQSLVSSQIDTIGITIGVLFMLFMLIFRSFALALIAVVANLIPLMIVFGVMGAFGIPLDVMSITIAAIAYGIGVDDIIHYIHRYLAGRSALGAWGAIMSAHASTGRAMYYTSVAIFVGFSMMMTSKFAPTVYFGGLICLVMVAMLASALILLPAMIYVLDRGKFKGAS